MATHHALTGVCCELLMFSNRYDVGVNGAFLQESGNMIVPCDTEASAERVSRSVHMKFCKRCHTEKKQHSVAVPCGHIFCERCSSDLKLCPICETPIEKFLPLKDD
eukprot:scaffold251067_cov25-Prasinocladus_malaysianus.AAC.2